MAKEPIYTITPIREWRESLGLSLETVANRMQDECGVATTKTSLSRIERGLQPYSQQLLEALARVLGAPNAGYILIGGPLEQSDVHDFLGAWFERARTARRNKPKPLTKPKSTAK